MMTIYDLIWRIILLLGTLGALGIIAGTFKAIYKAKLDNDVIFSDKFRHLKPDKK